MTIAMNGEMFRMVVRQPSPAVNIADAKARLSELVT
jgi:hypothetical protein